MIHTGDRVVARYGRRNPETGKERTGVVLAVDDPLAWKGSIAFGPGMPDADAVKRHVAWCRSQGLLDGEHPILWSFGRIYWEKDADMQRVSCGFGCRHPECAATGTLDPVGVDEWIYAWLAASAA